MREIQEAMEKASKEKAILLQYCDAIKAATGIGLDYTALTPEELILMFMAGEFEPTDPTHQEEARQTAKSCTILVPIILLYLCRTLVSNLNSTELHLQGVAPRSQYSDPMPEAVTLQ